MIFKPINPLRYNSLKFHSSMDFRKEKPKRGAFIGENWLPSTSFNRNYGLTVSIRFGNWPAPRWERRGEYRPHGGGSSKRRRI
jgi:hypothetical protein